MYIRYKVLTLRIYTGKIAVENKTLEKIVVASKIKWELFWFLFYMQMNGYIVSGDRRTTGVIYAKEYVVALVWRWYYVLYPCFLFFSRGIGKICELDLGWVSPKLHPKRKNKKKGKKHFAPKPIILFSSTTIIREKSVIPMYNNHFRPSFQ